MKTLYRQRNIMKVTYKTKRGNANIKYVSQYGRTHYGELPIGIHDYSTKWNQLLNYEGYCDEDFVGIKSNKGIYANISYIDKHGYKCQKRVYENDFVMVEYTLDVCEVSPSEITTDRAIKDLTLDEFKSYMNDNGEEKI